MNYNKIMIEHIQMVEEMIENPEYRKIIEDISSEIVKCYTNEKAIFIYGNGGSAADAQHIAAEFVNRFKIERNPLPARALSTDSSIITSIGNDYNFDEIFSKQIQAYGKEGDVSMAISTGGSSHNILKAIDESVKKKMIVIGFTGCSNNEMSKLAEKGYIKHIFRAPSCETARVQEAHELAYHIICGKVEEGLFG